MKTNFDHTFENKRLDMLKHQFFSNMDVSGEILFRSLDDDHRIDSARFIFDIILFVFLFLSYASWWRNESTNQEVKWGKFCSGK